MVPIIFKVIFSVFKDFSVFFEFKNLKNSSWALNSSSVGLKMIHSPHSLSESKVKVYYLIIALIRASIVIVYVISEGNKKV